MSEYRLSPEFIVLFGCQGMWDFHGVIVQKVGDIFSINRAVR